MALTSTAIHVVRVKFCPYLRVAEFLPRPAMKLKYGVVDSEQLGRVIGHQKWSESLKYKALWLSCDSSGVTMLESYLCVRIIC